MTRTIAAFDFDGTITKKDTLIPFLHFAFGRVRTYLKILPLLPKLSLFFFGHCTRQEAKELILTKFLKGTPLVEVEKLGKAFAEGPLMKRIKKEALERLKWHKSQGHIAVLISANPSFYLSFWTKYVGFDFCIASNAAIDERGCLTGQLQGLNCYGEEKVRRLIKLFGNHSGYFLYAYGDSRGDKELLEFADQSYFRRLS